MKRKWLSWVGVMIGWIVLVACTPFTTTPTQTITVAAPPVTQLDVTVTVSDPLDQTTPDTPVLVETAVEEPTVTATVENCAFGWSWASGPASPEFAQTVQEMMATAQITGTVSVSTYGENDGCGRYHAMSTDFSFTIPVADPTDEGVLTPLADEMVLLAQTANQGENRPAPNMGNLEILFENETQRCFWRYSGSPWNIRCEGIE